MFLENNYNKINTQLLSNVTLVAVSKTKPNQDILEAYNRGQRDFGENKVQDMVTKYEVLPKDIKWHMIGHVQRNKIKYMAEFVYLIHGVDSIKTLLEINKQAQKYNRTINCLLQVHIAEEDSKFGFNYDQIIPLFESEEFQNLENIKVKGLMGMATFTDNQAQVREEFSQLHTFFKKLQQTKVPRQVDMQILSMGMSGDYHIAVEEGSTMVRVGSAIFGERSYIA